MASNALVLVLSAGGRVGATGRYVTEDLLARGLSDVPTVFLRPAVFCEQVSRVSGVWIRRADTIALPWGSGRVPAVAARDVASVAAAVLENPASHHGQSYGLTGPTAHTPHEM